MIRLSSYLTILYSEKEAQKIQQELNSFEETLPKKFFSKTNTAWYKFTNLYVTYPDSILGPSSVSLQNLTHALPHIKKLGCNALHILPFLDSPMRDRGFDVSNYFEIRKELGTMKDLDDLKEKADILGLRLVMDLVFNHVSIEHEWFVRAQQGNEKYRGFFIHTKEKPQFLRKIHKKSAVWAEYLVKGEKKLVNITFPEFAGPIPHWVQGNDGYWYYHTFLPTQIDIDWRNPDVFIECAKILMFWTHKGFNFRFDAIPFIGKSAYKQLNKKENFTHHLLAAMNHLAKQINPECAFILETYEKVETVVKYLGNKNIEQAEMLYGFHVCTSLWVSLILKNTDVLWKKLKKIQAIPTFAQWINFLRNHDELSLSYLNDKTLYEVSKELLPRGQSFREGYGISGRTFSLLGENTERFLMAYFLLFSLPGGVLIPYGDEFGQKNLAGKFDDAREINRGQIALKQKDFLSHMLNIRQTMQLYFTTWPQKITSSKTIFSCKYELGNTHVLVFVNLTDISETISYDLKKYKKILHVNTIVEHSDGCILNAYAGIWLKKIC